MSAQRVKPIENVKIPPFAFIGRFASGKDLYADGIRYFLKLEFGMSVYQVPSFSDRITEMAIEIFDMQGKDRGLLQRLGDRMREEDPQVWAKYLIHKIEKEGNVPFVVEGFRDSEELQAFRDKYPNIVVVKIVADEKARIAAYKKKYGREPTEEELNHPTEKAIDNMPFDLQIFNTYKPIDLRMQISTIIEAIKTDTLSKLLRNGTVL